LIRVTLALGVLVTLVALAPTPVVAAVLLVFAGVASISFLAVGNTTLQLAADPGMRGRVMAIWTMALLGSTPIGGLFVGWIGQWAGARWSLAVGGVAAVLASGYAWREQRIATREGGPTVTAPEPGPAALVN
jgi:MFS family permease